MPVSKKRKNKEGKPVHRSQTAPEATTEEQAAPEVKQTPLQQRVMGRASNPFVAQMPRRAAQRGR